MSDYPEFADPMERPRYTGLATFMRAPFAEDLSGLDIGLAGIPFDGGVTNRPGARHGPREIRNQSSLMRKINQANRIAPFDICRVADIGDAWVRKPFHLEDALDEIAGFFAGVHGAGVVPVSAGGDHSVTLPILRGIARERPVGLVHFDAHCDTGDDYLGSKFHHGAPFRRAVEEGLIEPERAIQIGIRGALNDLSIWDFSRESGMRVVAMEELYEIGVKAVIEEARRVVGDGPTYVSFDVDGLDPVYAPGTGTPEVGGFTTLEAQLMIRGLQGLDLIGGDVVEVSPPFDPTGGTALVGASMMFEILCVVTDAVAARRRRTKQRAVTSMNGPIYKLRGQVLRFGHAEAGANRNQAQASRASCENARRGPELAREDGALLGCATPRRGGGFIGLPSGGHSSG